MITSYVLGMACVVLAEKPGAKRPCPKGFYGKYTPNGLYCKTCPPGMIAPRIGMTECQPCPAKRIPNQLATKCISAASAPKKLPCQPGFYDTDGKRNCEPCPSGSISQYANKRQCKPCAGGKVPNEYRTKCINPPKKDQKLPCRPGNYVNKGVCKPCPLGSITKASNRRVCKACGPGKTSNPSRTKCVNKGQKATCSKAGQGCSKKQCCGNLSCNIVKGKGKVCQKSAATTTPPTTTKASPCPPGMYGSGGKSCKRCPVNSITQTSGRRRYKSLANKDSEVRR